MIEELKTAKAIKEAAWITLDRYYNTSGGVDS
jgi:hypothetical protein